MSTTLESSADSPWRKRPHDNLEDIDDELKRLKRPRYCYFRLASESSKTSEDDTESVYSLQDKETDVIRDTSDTDSKAETESVKDEYEVEFEYEVASLSEADEHGLIASSSESEGDMMLVAAAAVMCDSSLEAWVTDVEDSDSSSDDASLGRGGFSVCIQCKGENDNPLFRYCEKCFQSCRQCKRHKTFKCFPLCQSCYQDRKKHFPPRPRRNRRKNTPSIAPKNPVKLDTLRSCLSGLSQDSGLGSSQECPVLGWDKIVVPEHLQQGSGTSISEDLPASKSIPVQKVNHSQSTPSSSQTSDLVGNSSDFIESDLGKSQASKIVGKDSKLGRKRHSSESSLSDFEIKKPKIDTKPEAASDLCSEVSSSSSSTSGFSSDLTGFSVHKPKSESELCIFCNSAPKDSIFLHTNIAHRCCCYKCAKKTLKTIKRCPICNGSVNKVVKIFTS